MDAAIKHAGALHAAEVAAWQEEPLAVSKYAQGLVQLANTKKISPDPRVSKRVAPVCVVLKRHLPDQTVSRGVEMLN